MNFYLQHFEEYEEVIRLQKEIADRKKKTRKNNFQMSAKNKSFIADRRFGKGKEKLYRS